MSGIESESKLPLCIGDSYIAVGSILAGGRFTLIQLHTTSCTSEPGCTATYVAPKCVLFGKNRWLKGIHNRGMYYT